MLLGKFPYGMKCLHKFKHKIIVRGMEISIQHQYYNVIWKNSQNSRFFMRSFEIIIIMMLLTLL